MPSLSPIRQMSSFSGFKKRVLAIDEEIEKLARAVENLSDGRLQAELEHTLFTAKLKRQKLSVMSAVANTQKLLAEMHLLTAECDLNIELANVRNCKRLKLDTSQARSRTTESKSKRHTSSCSSSRNSKKENKRRSKPKSAVDKDATVLVETLESCSIPKIVITGSPPSLTSTSNSNSASSLTSSLVSEFNRPYLTEKPQNKVELKTNAAKKSNSEENCKKKLNQNSQPTSCSLPELPAHKSNEPQPVSSTPIKHSLPAIICKPSKTIFVARNLGFQYHDTFLPQHF